MMTDKRDMKSSSSNSSIVVETTDRNRSKPTCHVLISDFANMVKAFIGSNYLTIAYAFTQSGLVLGILGLMAIAVVTDHCCHLIVKCKYHAMNKILGKKRSISCTAVNKEGGVLVATESDSEDDGVNDQETYEVYKQMMRSLTYGDVGRIAAGRTGILVVNACLLFTQFGFCVGYFIFVGNTVSSLFPYKNTTTDLGENISLAIYPRAAELDSMNNGTQDLDLSGSLDYFAAGFGNSSFNDLTTVTHMTSSAITSIPMLNSTAIPMVNLSHYISVSQSPDLRYLVIAPLPVFVGFAFLRDVRHLGFVSVGADISIFVGCIVTLAYIVMDFTVSSTWNLYEWSTLPVFFGMVTSSYEGIGTIIPIESSMEGNRHNFTRFLHGAVFILTAVLAVFGVVGYLEYGSDTEQMLNKNIPTNNGFGMAINVFLCVGVILTFPLQIYPVIELSEIYTFGHGRICGPKKESGDSDDESAEGRNSDSEALLPKKEINMPAPVATVVPDEVSAWKRNILRIIVVILAAGLAVLMRNFFAYVTAFVGAIGSSVLAYILPCVFHLKLCWHELGYGVRIKDMTIIIFGIVASVVSLYTTINEVVEKSS